MNTNTAEILCKLNNDFYRNQCESFSATRQSPWTGWTRCAQSLRGAYPNGCAEFSVFDLACGNLRFEEFLTAEFPGTAFDFYAVDNCDTLVPKEITVHYQSLDVFEALRKDQPLNAQFEAPQCDLSVSFGFMHHVPLPADRETVIRALIDQTRPGGLVMVSFWQFMKNENMAKKAVETHERARAELGIPELDEGDYLLGWKDTPGQYRYCHSFSEEEIDQLAEVVSDKAKVVAHFTADGRTNNLNTYLLLSIL